MNSNTYLPPGGKDAFLDGDHDQKPPTVKKSEKHGGERDSDELSADNLLSSMGYQAELVRSRSTLQVAFMSFVLASIPYGLSTTFYYPLVGGGPANVIWGWVAVSLIILCVAISLGEITSVYPTAGGVYYQTFMIAPPWCRLITSWICGWSYVVGNITITLAVNFGTTLFFIACVNVFESEPGVGVWAEPTTYQIFLVFVAITVLCNLVSALGNKWLPWLDTFAIFWTFAGVIATVVCVLALAKEGRNSAKFVFTHFEPTSGWPAGWSFCVGLLQAAYATSSTGMIISMCEETQNPSVQVPKAMVGTIILNTICGLLFMIPLLFVLPNLADMVALASGQPVPPIIASAVGSQGGAFALLIPLMVLAVFCGIGCTTAASRCTWAFSRDGAIPGSQLWRQINKSLDVPLNAMMLSMIVQILLGFLYFGSAAAFNAFSGVGVICLTVSYAIPIACSLFTGRTHIKLGKFDMGMLGLVCNVIAICWSLLAVPLFCMPSFIPVAADTMNYASAVFAAFIIIAGGWYFVWGRKHYAGPPVHEDPRIS
ncbi:amino acid/polyamine transporter I [Amylocarpus encephaloides]|uniref:Amino acid/polyamine transporter I n=1 Tax=Amylocarpus encephaloides TaxID=45428 RepID=A0A9P7YJX8_9HELO|nr:amino acid/polyamine transporter I [Amylocarpus encephaloides]